MVRYPELTNLVQAAAAIGSGRGLHRVVGLGDQDRIAALRDPTTARARAEDPMSRLSITIMSHWPGDVCATAAQPYGATNHRGLMTSLPPMTRPSMSRAMLTTIDTTTLVLMATARLTAAIMKATEGVTRNA